MTQRSTIVRGDRIANRSQKGNPAFAKARGLIQYIAYGHYQFDKPQEQERGQWLDHNGQEQSHDAILRWAKEKVHQRGYEYTYQLLLSTRHSLVQEQDFNYVLYQGSGISQVNEWRMMLHEDTDNQHAHVVLFRQEALSQAQYKAWQQTMQQSLDQMQQMRQEQQQELAQQLEQGQGQSL